MKKKREEARQLRNQMYSLDNEEGFDKQEEEAELTDQTDTDEEHYDEEEEEIEEEPLVPEKQKEVWFCITKSNRSVSFKQLG